MKITGKFNVLFLIVIDMNVKFIRTCILFLMGSLVFLSCRRFCTPIKPSDKIVSKQYKYEKIRGVSVSDEIILNYFPIARSNNVLVTGPDNVVSALKMKRDVAGILHFEISGRDKFKYDSDNQRLHIQVSIPCINHFKAMNGSSIYVMDNLYSSNEIIAQAYSDSQIKFAVLQASKVNFASYTDSEITACIKSDNCNVQSYTNSTISLSGFASFLNVTVSASIVDASKLSCKRITETTIDEGKLKHKD